MAPDDRPCNIDFPLANSQQNLICPIKGLKGESFCLKKLLLRDAQRVSSVLLSFPFTSAHALFSNKEKSNLTVGKKAAHADSD